MAVRDYDAIVAETAAVLRLDVANQPALLTLVQGWVNDTIQDIHGRHDWYWAKDRQVVQTVADKSAGTVSLSASGQTVTGLSTAFAASDVGSFIRFSTSNDWYKILTVTAADSLTIEAPYTSTASLSAGTYTIRKVFYQVPSAEKIISAKQASTPGDLVCIDAKDFDTYLTFGDSVGKANRFCVYGLDSNGSLQFNIYPHADEIYNLELRFKKAATQDSVNLIPPKWRGVYLLGSMVKGLEYISVGNPEVNRQPTIDAKKIDYERMITRMKGDAEPESDYHPVLQNRDVVQCNIGPRLPSGLSIPLDA